MTPTARTTPMMTIAMQPATTAPADTEPSSKRGTMTLSVTHLTAQADASVAIANTAAPHTAMANGRRCNPISARSMAAPRRSTEAREGARRAKRSCSREHHL